MNIIIGVDNLSVLGGVERFACALASWLAGQGHRVTLFCRAPDAPVFALHPAVRICYKKVDGWRAHLGPLRRAVLAENPDVCLSPAASWWHVLWPMLLEDTGIPWVYSEHIAPVIVETESWNRAERLAVMQGADAIHLLLPSYGAALPLPLQQKTVVIANAVPLPPQLPARRQGNVLLYLGRLACTQKQPELLLQAFALLAEEFPQWRLQFWGNGPDAERLEALRDTLQLRGRAELCGPTQDAASVYAGADLFCIPSAHEGFPLTVMEAMGTGLPVVGFAACPGVNEQVQHGFNGLLAGEMTAASLAAELRRLMADAPLRAEMGRAARQTAEQFVPESIYPQWEKCLEAAARCKGRTALQAALRGENGTAGTGYGPGGNGGAEDAGTAERCALLRRIIGRAFVASPAFWARAFVFQHPVLERWARPVYRALRALKKKCC